MTGWIGIHTYQDPDEERLYRKENPNWRVEYAREGIKMGFMQRFIYGPEDGFEVETTHGTEWVPGHVLLHPDPDPDSLADYVEGKIQSVQKVHGYFGRYSAPGYMDCTEWSFDESEAVLMAHLDEMYGDDEPEESREEYFVNAEPCRACHGKNPDGSFCWSCNNTGIYTPLPESVTPPRLLCDADDDPGAGLTGDAFRPETSNWEVTVSNVGTVYDGPDEDQAIKTFEEYRDIADGPYGKPSGETVTLLTDGEVTREHEPVRHPAGSQRHLRDEE